MVPRGFNVPAGRDDSARQDSLGPDRGDPDAHADQGGRRRRLPLCGVEQSHARGTAARCFRRS